MGGLQYIWNIANLLHLLLQSPQSTQSLKSELVFSLFITNAKQNYGVCKGSGGEYR